MTFASKRPGGGPASSSIVRDTSTERTKSFHQKRATKYRVGGAPRGWSEAALEGEEEQDLLRPESLGLGRPWRRVGLFPEANRWRDHRNGSPPGRARFERRQGVDVGSRRLCSYRGVREPPSSEDVVAPPWPSCRRLLRSMLPREDSTGERIWRGAVIPRQQFPLRTVSLNPPAGSAPGPWRCGSERSVPLGRK